MDVFWNDPLQLNGLITGSKLNYSSHLFATKSKTTTYINENN
jgi:hypothetical protein